MKRFELLNQDAAQKSFDAIKDPVVKNLVQLAQSAAIMAHLQEGGQSDADYEKQLPAVPFDMEFFVKVVTKAYSNKALVQKILDGQSIAQATGWEG